MLNVELSLIEAIDVVTILSLISVEQFENDRIQNIKSVINRIRSAAGAIASDDNRLKQFDEWRKRQEEIINLRNHSAD